MDLRNLRTDDPDAALAFYGAVFGRHLDRLGDTGMWRRRGYGAHLAASVDPGIGRRLPVSLGSGASPRRILGPHVAPGEVRPVRAARGQSFDRGAVAAVVVVVVVAVGAVLLGAGDRSRLDEVRDTLGLSGCERSRPTKDPDLDAWNAAVETETDVCGHLGSGLTYARFPSDRALRSTLLGHPPSGAVCLVEPHQVLLIDLVGGANADACHRVRGVVVARTEHVAPATGQSIGATARSEERFERQAAVAEGHALRRYWAAHPVR